MNNDKTLEQNLYPLENKSNSNRWMMTFADLLSLVLTFFVLIYSMSELDTHKWTEISQSLSKRLNPYKIIDFEAPTGQKTITKIKLDKALDLNYLTSIIKNKIIDLPEIRKHLRINHTDERLIISIDSNLLFAKNTTNLSENGLLLLDVFSTPLQTIKNHLDIYGNAPDFNESSTEYQSKWQLALTRAISISQHLRNNGYGYNITTYGRSGYSFTNISDISQEDKKILEKTIDLIIRDYNAK